MKYRNNSRLPDSKLKMQLEFWRNIKSFIKNDEKMTFKEINEFFLMKFGYRVTKEHVLKIRGIDFDKDGFATI